LPLVELFLNGKSLGQKAMAWANWTQFPTPFPFEPGNLTAVGYSDFGDAPVAVASDSSITPQVAAAVVLTVDVPSAHTGTGDSLLLDGQDAAMLRASIVDANGVLASTASNNVSFSIVSGPGRILGVGNGNPTSHERNKASWRSAYHGLVRVVVQTTVNAIASPRQHDIDIEVRDAIYSDANNFTAGTSIVVEARVEGMRPARATIKVSQDQANDSVLAVAARNVHISGLSIR
jgi:hypothetical protein